MCRMDMSSLPIPRFGYCVIDEAKDKKNENTNKSEISISTDVHIDVLLVGTKIEGGLFFEE